MARESTKRRKSSGAGWIATLLGIAVLVVGGFALGLVVGVVSEEPELVVGHLAGRTTEVSWSGDARPDGPQPAAADAPHVASGPSFGRESADSAAEAAPKRTSGLGHSLARSAEKAGQVRPEPHFAIQVGAFGDADSARSVAAHLRDSGYPVHILQPESDDRWRVRVGPVEGRDEANRVAMRLKTEEQLPTWVLREQGS
jgi:cell division septation protein DedD